MNTPSVFSSSLSSIAFAAFMLAQVAAIEVSKMAPEDWIAANAATFRAQWIATHNGETQ